MTPVAALVNKAPRMMDGKSKRVGLSGDSYRGACSNAWRGSIVVHVLRNSAQIHRRANNSANRVRLPCVGAHIQDIGFTNVIAVIMNFEEWQKKGNPVL